MFLFFSLFFILFTPFPGKKQCFLTLKKHVLEIQMTWNQKFSTNSAGEGLQSHQLRLSSLFSVYSGSNKICKWHVCSSVFKGAKITPSIVTHTNIKEKSRNWPLQLQNIKILWKKLIESTSSVSGTGKR